MANVRGEGTDVPIVFPIGSHGHAVVSNHLLHVRFRYHESSVYVEEEKMDEDGSMLQTIPVSSCEESGLKVWHLPPGNYRAYGLPLSLVIAAEDIRSQQSGNSSVDMPYFVHRGSQSPVNNELRIPCESVPVKNVKLEVQESMIMLSSESEGESPEKIMKEGVPEVVKVLQKDVCASKSSACESSQSPSLSSRPPVYPTLQKSVSIVDSLKRLGGMHRSRNELSTVDLNGITHHVVSCLPAVFDGDIIFELPPCRSSRSFSAARNLEGMDKRYDGHPWCKVVTTNISNTEGLKF